MKKVVCFTVNLVLTVLLFAVPVQAGGEVWDNIKSQGSAVYEKAKQKLPEVKEKAKAAHEEASERISEFREGQEAEFWQNFEDQTGVDTGLTEDAADQSEDGASQEDNASSSSEPVTIIPVDISEDLSPVPPPVEGDVTLPAHEPLGKNVVDPPSPTPSPVSGPLGPEPIDSDAVSHRDPVLVFMAVIVGGLVSLLALASIITYVIYRRQRKR